MSEQCHVYIVRKADQEEWMAKAKEGEGIALICMRAGTICEGRIKRAAALYLLRGAILVVEFARGLLS
jgi:hypothetical protein